MESLPTIRSEGVTRSRTAFSLIELLCVIGIIGILLSLLLPAVFGASPAETVVIVHEVGKERTEQEYRAYTVGSLLLPEPG